jgi:hypothetical protein
MISKRSSTDGQISTNHRMTFHRYLFKDTGIIGRAPSYISEIGQIQKEPSETRHREETQEAVEILTSR